MISRRTVLNALLRATGALMLAALFAACMPRAWMHCIHGFMGLGEMPDAPIVDYLARSASLLYAFQGAALIFISFNSEIYAPFIRFMAWLGVVFAFFIPKFPRESSGNGELSPAAPIRRRFSCVSKCAHVNKK